MNRTQPIYSVINKITGKLLHIRITESNESPEILTTTLDACDWWVSRSYDQADAQAAILGRNWTVAEITETVQS